MEGLLPEVKKVQELFPDDKKKQGRALVLSIKDRPEIIRFLDKYIATEDEDPRAFSWQNATLNVIRDTAVELLGINKAFDKLDILVGNSFKAKVWSESQKPLRETIPAELREFLPDNLVVEVDENGYIKAVTDRFGAERMNLGEKIKRMRLIVSQYNNIVRRVKKDLRSSDELTRIAALVTAIIMETGIRPGKVGNSSVKTENGEKIEIETFGATTLGPEHVRFIRENFAELEFIGKKGGVNTASLSDTAIIQALQDYVDKALTSGSKYVFVTSLGEEFKYTDLQRYFKDNFKGIAPTDFRKLRATEAILSGIREQQEELYRKTREFVGDETEVLRAKVVQSLVEMFEIAISKAQKALSHDSADTTRGSYINPEILLRFLSTGRAAMSIEEAILDGEIKLSFDPKKFVPVETISISAAKKVASRYLKATLREVIEALEEDLRPIREASSDPLEIASKYAPSFEWRRIGSENWNLLKGTLGHPQVQVSLSSRVGSDSWVSTLRAQQRIDTIKGSFRDVLDRTFSSIETELANEGILWKVGRTVGFHGHRMTPEQMKLPGPQFTDQKPIPPRDVEEALKYLKEESPGVLVGYSRGGGLAMLALKGMSGNKPRVIYVAPAWRRGWTDITSPPSSSGVIVHGDKDDVVPLQHSCDLSKRTGLPLQVVPGRNHVTILKDKLNPGAGKPVSKEMIQECVKSLPDWGSGEGSQKDLEKQIEFSQRLGAQIGTGEEFAIGGGFRLVNKLHPAAMDSETWDFEKGGIKVGYVTIHFYREEGPSVGDIRVDPRGLGLGRKAILALVRKYGQLSSDIQGVTSNDAVRMWQSLGAEKVATRKNLKGFYWHLPPGKKAMASRTPLWRYGWDNFIELPLGSIIEIVAGGMRGTRYTKVPEGWRTETKETISDHDVDYFHSVLVSKGKR